MPGGVLVECWLTGVVGVTYVFLVLIRKSGLLPHMNAISGASILRTLFFSTPTALSPKVSSSHLKLGWSLAAS